MSGQHYVPAPGKEPGTHSIEGWLGPSSGLDYRLQEKSSDPVGDRIPVVQSVISNYADLLG